MARTRREHATAHGDPATAGSHGDPATAGSHEAGHGRASKIRMLVARARRLKPVRVFLNYTQNRGPLLASGLSFHAIFAVFAALWVVFSVAGLFLQSNPDLRNAFLTFIGTAAPGLIDSGNGSGAIDPRMLLEARVLGWTGAIALVGLLLTALGWLDACRQAVRTIFGLAAPSTNFLLLKLKDFGLAVGFGAAVAVSAVLSLFSTHALAGILTALGIDGDSLVSSVFGRILGLAVMFLLDAAVVAALFRILAGVAIPARRLVEGALLGAAGLGVLKILGTVLLGGATRNPLLASFAVIIGLLIWFNLVCQIILVAASWIAVDLADHGIDTGPAPDAAPAEAAGDHDRQAADEPSRAKRGSSARALRRRRRGVER